MEIPVITGTPADITQNLIPNRSGRRAAARVTWIPPTASDNSGEVTLSSSKEPGDSFDAGTTVVTYIARDPSSNFVTTSFKVTVIGMNIFSNSSVFLGQWVIRRQTIT